MKPRVEVRSFGCSANFSEGESMKGLLAQKGFDLSDTPESEILLLNACTVKGDHGPLKEIRNALLENPQKKIVVSGCVTPALSALIQKEFPQASITNTHHLEEIDSFVNASLSNTPQIDLSKKSAHRVRLPKVRENSVVGILPVSNGCLDRCAFCSTVQIKGKLESYRPQDIFEEVQDMVADGCKEIWLTGQDAACYGFDLNTNLAELVKKLVEIPGDFKIRLGMGNPRHLVLYIDSLIEVMQHPKVFQFLHLPVQAGSSKVLVDMKRQHGVEEYDLLVKKIRAVLPRFTLSTDIIVGFPTETEDDFEQTMELLRRSRPSVCNRTRYVPRARTPAFNLPELPKEIKKERSRRLTDLFKEIALENNKEWIGWEGEILIDEFGKHPGSSMGRNYAYKPVAIQGEYPFGTTLKVRITGAETFCLLAELL